MKFKAWLELAIDLLMIELASMWHDCYYTGGRLQCLKRSMAYKSYFKTQIT